MIEINIILAKLSFICVIYKEEVIYLETILEKNLELKLNKKRKSISNIYS